MARILIVEDDAALRQGIALSLRQDGNVFGQAGTARQAEELLAAGPYDLALLDVNLPDGSGLALCAKIRRAYRVPVIFITANDLENDVVTGLELGADDYITKPFSLPILRARVAAALRRQKPSGEPYEQGPFRFDFDALLFWRQGREVALSRNEQRLLRLLVENRGRVLPRAELVDRLWPEGAELVEENALSVTVRRLRAKLEEDAAHPRYIQTVYGIGYTWAVK